MVNVNEYYALLGLKPGASPGEIKKAYRRKVMQYHPDRNPDPGASTLFIRITEAYQYLISAPVQSRITDEEREKYYASWVNYRREEAKRKAEAYARESYIQFRNSDLYKSTYYIDPRMIWFGLGLSVFIIVYTIIGYSYRVSIATCANEMPSIALMILSLAIGLVFLTVTVLYFLAWKADKKKASSDRKTT
ncbi:MAG TPA: J domain-containing protein [Bacteroidales bacterium]|nr:J domain-containing protein [Bacteroidales bacterium]HPT11489.1 J domain-containing protein [Bacteroidales bacterium]